VPKRQTDADEDLLQEDLLQQQQREAVTAEAQRPSLHEEELEALELAEIKAQREA
jgi:hypothetical protein